MATSSSIYAVIQLAMPTILYLFLAINHNCPFVIPRPSTALPSIATRCPRPGVGECCTGSMDIELPDNYVDRECAPLEEVYKFMHDGAVSVHLSFVGPK